MMISAKIGRILATCIVGVSTLLSGCGIIDSQYLLSKAEPKPRIEEYMEDTDMMVHECVAEVPILMYHGIGTGSDYGITKKEFREQLDYFVAEGYNTLTLDDIIRFRLGMSCPKGNVVALTFDDGLESLYSTAYPELSKRSYNAIAFIPLGTKEVTDKQMKVMAESGVVELESHLFSHETAAGVYSDNQMIQELRKSKARLQEIIGMPVMAVAWPGGERRDGEHDKDLALNEGYIALFEGWGGTAKFDDGTMDIPRVDVHWFKTWDDFIKYVE